MAQGESKRSRDIMRALEGEGAFCFKVHGGAMMMAGLPDIICCYEGRFYGLETKMAKGKASTIQQYIHGKIRKAGGEAGVVKSVKEAVDWVVHGQAPEQS